MRATEPLLHIAPTDGWHAAGDDHYTDPSLEDEGFIHCSTPAQVLIPANERFAGRHDLVLLVIDPSRVEARIAFEDCYETGLEFPHVYGPIPKRAVINVVAFPPSDDGTFSLPPEIAALGAEPN